MKRNKTKTLGMRAKRWWIIVISGLLAVLLALAYYFWIYEAQDTSYETTVSSDTTEQVTNENNNINEAQTAPEAEASTEEPNVINNTGGQNTPVPAENSWPVQISASDASSLTVVVNKKHQLPSSYIPPNLTSYGGFQIRSDASSALTSMVNAAKSQGYQIKLISGYRSFAYQQNLYNNYVKQYGQAKADTFSARPGHSEHQTGLGLDVGNGTCDLEICFGDTPAGKWIAANAQNYGFIVRYPSGKETETGYQYEPWHLRYLGTETAKAVYSSGKTLDQYYNVPAGGYE